MTIAASLAGGAALLATGWRVELADVRAAREPDYTPVDRGEAMLQRYRLHIYDGQYEVMPNDLFVIDVDLDSSTCGAILNRQFVALVRLAGIRNEPMDAPVMTVHDLKTDKKIMDWVG
jgi:hypothetical protein